MQELEVGAIVDSIRAAFDSGVDVLQQMDLQRHSKRPKKALISSASSRAHESLLGGSQIIKSCYDQNAELHGQKYIIGDALAQTQLARILLNLNTSFLALINLVSIRNSGNRAVMKQRLISLSNGATADTLGALDALHQRMSNKLGSGLQSKSRTKAPGNILSNAKTNSRSPKSPRTSKPSTDVAEPNPLLTRGGWVRTKSGNAIKITAADARQRAVRKSDKKRVASDSQSQKQIEIEPASKSTICHSPTITCDCKFAEIVQPAEHLVTKHPLHLAPSVMQRPPSLYIVPSDFFRSENLISVLPPARPPKIPLHTRPNPNAKPRPVSGATFLTASTKIGEIPENRIPDRVLSEEEKMSRPVPYTIPPPLFEMPKRKRKGFWLFKKPVMAVP